MPTIQEVVTGYIKLRAVRDEVRKKQKEELAPFTEKLLKMEAWLQRYMKAQGVQNTKTPNGTAYMTVITKPVVRDSDAFLEFLQAHDLMHMLNVSANKEAVTEYLEANGELPPGISVTRETFARVRK